MRRSPVFWSVVIALAARVAWVLAVPTKPVGDFAMYREAAAYLAEGGALDPEFVYMPGYVGLLALCERLGGGLLAAKLVGAGFGALAAAAAAGIACALFGRRAAWIAGLGASLWPAGIALASVTGTDMPGAALCAAAVWALVGWGPSRPRRAAIACGVLLGLAAWIRAVALPLAVVSAVYWIARRERGPNGRPVTWRESARRVASRTALTLAAALVVLAPWAIRNRLRYGEWLLTDSHGGMTALVGANPDSDGRYSRSLNRLFEEVTGRQVFAEPHREADRDAYAWARRFTAFEPAFALGLVGAKAERLLARERGLLYWPIFRAGVLPPERAAAFAASRDLLEGVVDGFWWLLGALALGGVGLCIARRDGPPAILVAFAATLAILYVVFFAEVRYQLPIALLAFPLAAGFAASLPAIRRDRRLAMTSLGFATLVICVASLALGGASRLRDRHRWAASLCRIDGAPRACLWRSVDWGTAVVVGDSPVRGAWDSMGLVSAGVAETTIDLPAGRYRVSGKIAPSDSRASLVAAIDHSGGAYTVRFASPGSSQPVWLSEMSVTRELVHNPSP